MSRVFQARRFPASIFSEAAATECLISGWSRDFTGTADANHDMEPQREQPQARPDKEG